MKVVLFHIQVRKDVNKPEYDRTFERMFELVSETRKYPRARVNVGGP